MGYDHAKLGAFDDDEELWYCTIRASMFILRDCEG